MAKGPNPRPRSGAPKGGPAASRQKPTPGRTGSAPAPTGQAGRQAVARKSVAAARATKPGANRTQLIIGGSAIVVMAIVVIVGLVLNSNQAAPTSAYGASTKSTATLSGTAITVSSTSGSTPKVTLDFYEDALCPICGAFEQQFGQQVNEAVDGGKLVARFHMLDFLNGNSASGDYSTRAAAALRCVAADTGTKPGGFLSYLENLYAGGTQPAEKGSSDLTNAQLADLATKNGATAGAATCITVSSQLAAAKSASAAGEQDLTTAIGTQWGTPTVLRDGKPVNIDTKDWLTTLLA